jgi:hypothetical protein
MVVRPIAAGPHLIVTYQPRQPHGSPAGRTDLRRGYS